MIFVVGFAIILILGLLNYTQANDIARLEKIIKVNNDIIEKNVVQRRQDLSLLEEIAELTPFESTEHLKQFVAERS